MSHTTPSIRGGAVALRYPEYADLECVFATFGDPEVMKFVNGALHVDRDASQSFLTAARASWIVGLDLHWTIERIADRYPIGMFRWHLKKADLEIGYALRREVWGHGYAKDAAMAVFSYYLRDVRLSRIWAHVPVQNPRSISVLKATGLHVVTVDTCTRSSVEGSHHNQEGTLLEHRKGNA